jgi:hypothetical protein
MLEFFLVEDITLNSAETLLCFRKLERILSMV